MATDAVEHHRLSPSTLAGAAALVAWTTLASFGRPGTPLGQAAWAASLAIVVLCGVTWGVAARRGPPGPPAGAAEARGSSLPWLALAVAVAAWEALGIDTRPHALHLTLSSLALHFQGVRAAAELAWSGIGLAWARVRADEARRRRPRPLPGTGTRSPGVPPLVVLALLIGTDPATGFAFFAVVIAATGALEVRSRRPQSEVASLAELLRRLSNPPVLRLACAAAWVFGGWHLFAH